MAAALASGGSSSSSEPGSSSSEALCDGIPYNPLTQFCYNSSKVGNFCDINLQGYLQYNPQKYYDPDLYE